MRNTLIFAGSSCPGLTSQICQNLGMAPAAVELSQFANGETSVKIMTSIRDKDVFVVQSGSEKINDSIMELLIMISACKGGSANKITAVLPYFPYSRQSKKKSHRGAITARMLANLLHIAGVNHVITIDLHASQMQGFFRCPVDNLHAEPLIARWIRNNVDNWREAVCVSKNAGGTKRVTSLADALKLNFGMVTTDRRRHGNMSSSMLLDGCGDSNQGSDSGQDADTATEESSRRKKPGSKESNGIPHMTLEGLPIPRKINLVHPSPLRTTVISSPPNTSHMPISQVTSELTQPSDDTDDEKEDEDEDEDEGDEDTEQAHEDNEEELEYTDERAREVVHGRLIQGHIVEDDYPSPSMSAMSSSVILDHPDDDPMAHSRNSSYFTGETHALGGTGDPDALSDEEEEVFTIPDVEQTITLVGNVKGRTVFIVDDMIDKAGSWIAAAETVVKRGGARKVYIIATHGLFGGDSLQQLQNCDCIDTILVTNSFPIPEEKAKAAKKLIILDLSNLLGEAIRRNHHGESISALYQHIHD